MVSQLLKFVIFFRILFIKYAVHKYAYIYLYFLKIYIYIYLFI